MKKLIILLSLSLLFISCASTDYVEKNHSKNVELLKISTPYTSSEFTASRPEAKANLVDQARATQIREYFKANTTLDLDAISASQKSTWEKAIEVAVFVAKNIPHNNQKEFLVERNAITLWEYSRRVKTGFNCRWHATILSELLLSIDIKNSFVTCLPFDKKDGDCHVVNIIWLPELNKWAMLDCDMTEYITDLEEPDIPLSLEEMREYIQNDKEFTVNVLPGFENSWVAKPSGLDYMQAYWAKNLYWFALYTVYAFDLEGERNNNGSSKYASYYTCLVPPDYNSLDFSGYGVVTSDANWFWK